MLQPNSQGHGSYFEAFKRRSNVTLDAGQRDKLLTDRGAYLNFLEIQLERVSAACITSQHFGSRIDAATAKATAAEEKVMSATKLVRLAQTYSEEQGREQGRINDAMEIRLESLEQQIDAVSAAVDDAAMAQSNNLNVGTCVGDHDITSPRHPPVYPPGLHAINTAGLSEWMTGVDRQLEDLRNLVSAQITTGSGSSSGGGAGDGGSKATTEVGSSPQSDDDAEEATAVPETKTAAEATARDECARIEERVRRLEEAVGETSPGAGHSGGDSSLLSPATTVVDQRDRGRRLERCAELAREGLTRSRSASRSPFRRSPSAPPPATEIVAAPLASDAGTLTVEAGNDVSVGALEDGAAVARRASKVAEEALKAGREAIERSGRTENLAKTIAVRSFKLAKERHEEVTTVLDRLGDDIRRKGDRIVRCRPRSAGESRADGVDSARPAGTSGTTPSAGAAGGRRGRCRRAVSATPEERRRSAKARRGDARGFDRQALHDAEGATEQLATAQDPGGGDTGTHRSVREIREILENSSFADSDNGRRIALGAARTALESILREASPGPPPDRGTGRRPHAAQARPGAVLAGDGGNEGRRADELREAIRGAVTILSGIGGGGGPNVQGEEETRQRHPSRCSRLGRRPGSRLSKSRDRRPTTSPPRGCRDGKRHAESYWVPPGSIPCKVGERRGGGGSMHHVRAPLEFSGDEGREEAGAVADVVR
ncbi:unnamed protein product [Ectocarpus sp. 12 AP-2014]